MTPHKLELPQTEDWNKFWALEQTKRFTKISWSKRRIMNVVQPFVAKGKSALDAGCGSGFFSRYFCDQGMHTVALDYSQEALHIASELTNGKAKTVRADILSSDLVGNFSQRFDIVFTDGLLEHFEDADQDKIMMNLSKLLAPEGILATFVPNRWSPWECIRPFFMPGIKETPFVLKQLIRLNQRNGLKVFLRGGINTFPFSFSPDKILGPQFGMLLYTLAKR